MVPPNYFQRYPMFPKRYKPEVTNFSDWHSLYRVRKVRDRTFNIDPQINVEQFLRLVKFFKKAQRNNDAASQ